MAQLVKALRYRPEAYGFDSLTVSLEFSLTQYGSGVDSAFSRNELLGCKVGRCVGLISLPPSCADRLEIWVPHPSGPLRPVQACIGIALPDNFWLFKAVGG